MKVLEANPLEKTRAPSHSPLFASADPLEQSLLLTRISTDGKYSARRRRSALSTGLFHGSALFLQTPLLLLQTRSNSANRRASLECLPRPESSRLSLPFPAPRDRLPLQDFLSSTRENIRRA